MITLYYVESPQFDKDENTQTIEATGRSIVTCFVGGENSMLTLSEFILDVNSIFGDVEEEILDYLVENDMQPNDFLIKQLC